MNIDYTDWGKADLIKEIKQLKKRKKFGLVWEEKLEEVVEMCKEQLPVIVEDKSKALLISSSQPTNILIEGDNFHALSVLNYTHADKIDAIYVDPPYNTGAQNWVYNNNYVDGNDAFRHSKWLSFMEKRLVLAKSLLKKTGIIVVTIDDYEVATLTLLMNEIFGEENHLGTIIIKNNPQGRSSVSGFQISHEYALYYGRSQHAKIGRLARTQEQLSRYSETDDKGVFEWRNFRAQYSTESPKMKYPIFVKRDCSDFRIPKMAWNKETQSFDLLEQPDTSEVISLPVDPKGRMRTWKWALETVKTVKDTEMGARLDQGKNPSVYYKGRMKVEDMLPFTVWDKPEYSASTMGTNLLTAMLGEKKFDYPKSLYAVIDSLRVLSANKSATYLDFFAGSGTTGHAVLEMNKQDGGNRRFILCTNNENSIAEEVTYPRVRNVALGYKIGSTQIEGLGGNIKYYRTTFVDRVVTDADRRDFVGHATEMLCLAEATFGEKKFVKGKYSIYSNNNRTTAIIYDEDYINEAKLEFGSVIGKLTIYVFSYDNTYDDNDFSDLKGDITVRPIPAVILNVYSRVMRQAAKRINI